MNTILGPIAVIFVVIVVFLLLREFWCWYFKINKVVKLLEKIEENTRKAGPPPVQIPKRY